MPLRETRQPYRRPPLLTNNQQRLLETYLLFVTYRPHRYQRLPPEIIFLDSITRRGLDKFRRGDRPDYREAVALERFAEELKPYRDEMRTVIGTRSVYRTPRNY